MIYNTKVPQIENSKTTYNVGIINGGTSVNTISQTASVLCEYRSDNKECFVKMGEIFDGYFDTVRKDGVDVSVKTIGERPCMSDTIINVVDSLCENCKTVVESVTGNAPRYISSSTDCNIPLSLGIPAACIGVFMGGGMHKREERVDKSSLPIGLDVAINIALKLTE